MGPPVITPQPTEEMILNLVISSKTQTGEIPYNPDKAIWRHGSREGLGAPLTMESGDHGNPPDVPHDDGLTYRWQRFCLGMVLVPVGRWGEARVLLY